MKNVIYFHNGKTENSNTKYFLKSISSGSGSKSFTIGLEQFSDNYEFSTSGKYDNIEISIIQNITVFINCLHHDYYNGSMLLNYWGGGAEIIYLDKDNKFKKYNDITYILWKCTIDDEKKFKIIPSLIMKYEYKGNYLFIYSTNLNSIECHVVPGLLDDRNKYNGYTVNSQDINFNSNMVMNSFLVKIDGVCFQIFNAAIKGISNDINDFPSVHVRFADTGQLEVLWKQKFTDLVRDIIHSAAYREGGLREQLKNLP